MSKTYDTNVEAIREWVKRLRSGDYWQAQTVLCDENYYSDGEVATVAYCCLGVACEIAVEAGIVEKRRIDNNVYYGDFASGGSNSDNVLPKDVKEWFGLPDENPNLPAISVLSEAAYWDNHLDMVSLAELNDEHGFDFEKIADVIEEYFLP